MDTLLNDLKHSLRSYLKSPGFTLTALATLALGIGANTAVFSVVNAVLLKPVPFPDPDRLVVFQNTSSEGPSAMCSPAKFQHYREQTSVTGDVAAFRTGVVNLTGGAFPEQLQSGQVSANYFRLFGAPVIRGRTFTAEEDAPQGPHVALIGEGLWKRRFAADPNVVGKSISLSGDSYVIIGIIGAGFDTSQFGPVREVWVPFQLDPKTTDQGHYFVAAGRLKPGVSLAQAQAKLKLSAQDFERKFPRALGPGNGFSATPFQEAFVSDARPILLVLAAAVGLVLLIACANVANLLLVRATARRREIAIRAAIGAGRGRIVRQLLTESVLLSLVGGIAGLGLGLIGIRALLAVNTAGLPRLGEKGTLVGADWRVLGFTLLISIGTGILFGLIPALQSSRTDLSATLKETGSRSGTGFRQNKTRSVLVIAEVALALVLLVGSALLIRTSLALGTVEPGFDASNILTMRMSLSGPHFVKADSVDRLVRDGVTRLRTLPGVDIASATCCIPLEGGYGLPFNILGRPPANNLPFTGGAGWVTVSPGYFEVFKIPVKRGRTFAETDDKASRAVVIINQAMAKQYWKTGDPLRDQIMIGGGTMHELAAEQPRQIIGVVADSRDGALNRDPDPKMFVPQAQVTDELNALNVRLTPMAWVIRTKVRPASLSSAIQEQLRQVSGLPVSDVRTMDEVVTLSVSRQRFNMLLMTVFGSSALLLAAIGIYGLMAYSVEQRTQEIGIRLALGAETGAVRNMVVLQGMRLVLIGVAIGIGSAFGLTRFLAAFLFGVNVRDPMAFTSIPIALTCVALLAIWLPALRASRLDPIQALRYE
ncbi:MAG TPA: ABC transporter permease [Bryobacteraceae bacterium]|nr:ABC transporter permease [Bryobacteraceae bacterium]